MILDELINKHYKNFSETEKGIYQYIQKNQYMIVQMNIVDFAKESLSSKSSVIRFCQKIGFTGFSELRNFIKWNMDLADSATESYSFAEQVEKDTESLLNSLQDHCEWVPIYKALSKAENVYIITTGVTQQNQALEFQRLLMLTGKNSGIIFGNKHSTEFRHISTRLSEKDFVIVLSLSGDNQDLEVVVEKLKIHHVKLLSITNYSNNWLSKNCDYNLYARSSKSPNPNDWWLKTSSTFFVLIETFVFGFNDYIRENQLKDK